MDDFSGLRDLAEFLKTSTGPILETELSRRGVGGGALMLVPEGFEMKSVKPFIDEYRTLPERKKGVATMTDLASFITHVNRTKNEESAIFVARGEAKASLTAVYDYSQAQERGGEARWGQHRAVYPFPLSEEWKVWTGQNKQRMSVVDFAEFIENRILDIAPPPAEGQETARMLELQRAIGGSWAGQEKLMALSKGLAINVESKVIGAFNVQTGETTLQFKDEHKDEQGTPVKVPSLFLIAIPVFDRGAVYRIPVRLRYRVANGGVVWFYELYRPDLAIDDAIGEAAKKAESETGLPVFYGTPEAA